MPSVVSSVCPIYLDGQWRAATGSTLFHAVNPATRGRLDEDYPVSAWEDCSTALAAADAAYLALRGNTPEQLAEFLEQYADLIQQHSASLCAMATLETALPVIPRLRDVELPRTINQLRQAAGAAREGSWALPAIDRKNNLRSCLGPIGPVLIMGPNNFPFAYNAVAGGDFASAIATGNPVIAKGHPSQPGTTRLLMELAATALAQSALPRAMVQLLYHLQPEDGIKMVADDRVKAVGFTGSRIGGLKLKAAADSGGKPFFGELSSLNPVVILPGALDERLDKVVLEFTTSALASSGQFCTNPGLLLLQEGAPTERFIAAVTQKFAAAPVGTLLNEGVADGLAKAVDTLKNAGAQVLTGGTSGGGAGFSFANTLLRVSAAHFLDHSRALQTEAFGNSSLIVVATDVDEIQRVLNALEGNLTGSIYSGRQGADDAAYDRLAPLLREKVGRLLNDKMPTGVAVSSAMNHGGPFPATTQPHFTAVGFPAAMRRFTTLRCYDTVREPRLPPALRNKNPNGAMWRLVDGQWTRDDVAA